MHRVKLGDRTSAAPSRPDAIKSPARRHRADAPRLTWTPKHHPSTRRGPTAFLISARTASNLPPIRGSSPHYSRPRLQITERAEIHGPLPAGSAQLFDMRESLTGPFTGAETNAPAPGQARVMACRAAACGRVVTATAPGISPRHESGDQRVVRGSNCGAVAAGWLNAPVRPWARGLAWPDAGCCAGSSPDGAGVPPTGKI
jgi:hypothetical protein